MTAEASDDLGDILLEPYEIPAERRAAVRRRSIAVARKIQALEPMLAFDDEPSAHLAALRGKGAATAQ